MVSSSTPAREGVISSYEKTYGFGSLRVERDRIADLDLRVLPSAGVGYQFVESADFNLNAEAGLAYRYEKYDDDGTDEAISAKLGYHVDKALNPDVKVFHNLVYYPSLERLDDYYILGDVGLRADLTDKLFAEFKFEWILPGHGRRCHFPASRMKVEMQRCIDWMARR